MADCAARYDYIRTTIEIERHWLQQEFPDAYEAMTRILELDNDHWRKVGEPATGIRPWAIWDFREYLRRLRDKVERTSE